MKVLLQKSALHPMPGVKQMLMLLLVGLLVFPGGCAWFKKGGDQERATSTSESYDSADDMTLDDGSLPPPPSVDPEGPRPGQPLPFPELRVIYFDYDRSTIRPDQLNNAEHNLKYLIDNPGDKVLITGHCDGRGSVEYNFALGERRAGAVRDYYTKGGIDPGRIAIISRGEEEPVALGDTEEAYSLNRRCEFQRIN